MVPVVAQGPEHLQAPRQHWAHCLRGEGTREQPMSPASESEAAFLPVHRCTR